MSRQRNASMPDDLYEFAVERAKQKADKWGKVNYSGVIQEAVELLRDCLNVFGEDYREALKMTHPEPAYIRQLREDILARLDSIETLPAKQQEQIVSDALEIDDRMIG